MSDAKFNIRTNDKGSVIYHNNKPLVSCKGLFVKLVNHSFIIECASKDTLRELVKIAYLTQDKPKDSRAVIDLIEKLGENHNFKVHRGYVYESISLFETELAKL